jgi:hypothetical protein
MNGRMKVRIDTFKLAAAMMKKNVGIQQDERDAAKRARINSRTRGAIIVELEHCHIYHTYDSSGKEMSRCNHVGGHTHEITVSKDADGNLVAKCSPPIQNSPSETIVNDDDHTHNVVYLKSQDVELRRINEDAARMYSSFLTPGV